MDELLDGDCFFCKMVLVLWSSPPCDLVLGVGYFMDVILQKEILCMHKNLGW